MKSHINKAMIELIKKHHSPLCKDPNRMSMFNINIDDQSSVGLFAHKSEHISILFHHTGSDEDVSLTMLNFDANSGVEEIVFTYQQFEMTGYIDKAKAFTNSKMVFGLEPSDKCREVIDAADLLPVFSKLCNQLSNVLLSIIKRFLEKEDIGISLKDFGYINCN